MAEVSVIMPVYNCAQYVHEALRSILEQTFSDVEVFVIDDASTDHTVEVVKSIPDPRITLIVKPQNSGITDSLNMGLEMASGNYIARMDGDDVALPSRFEEQLKVLRENPEIVLCGTGIRLIPGNREIIFPEHHRLIYTGLLSGNTIAHPTVMFRRDLFVVHKLRYDRALEPAEDFDLWAKVARIGTMYNVPKALLQYRVHPQQSSETKRKEQDRKTNAVRAKLLSVLASPADAARFLDMDALLASQSLAQTKASLSWVRAFGKELIAQNKEDDYFDQAEFQAFVKSHNRRVVRSVFLYAQFSSVSKLFLFLIYLLKHPRYFSFREVAKVIVTNCRRRQRL